MSVALLAAVLISRSAAGLGPGPLAVSIPSTGQQLTAAIDAPADGASFPRHPGTIAIAGRCTIGDAPALVNVLYVVDVSGSTSLHYLRQNGIPLVDANGNGVAGDPGDDLNGDGEAGDILDGEIAGVLALNRSLGTATTVHVGVVAFASHAAAADVEPAAGVQLSTTPTADHDGAGGPDVSQVLRSLDSQDTGAVAGGSIGLFTSVSWTTLGNSTSFPEALAVANATLAAFPAAEHNLVFFLSDGGSNDDARCVGGACAEALDAAAAAGTIINTYGIGGAVDGEDLAFIAEETGGIFVTVPDPSRLAAGLPVPPPASLASAEVDGEVASLDSAGGFTAAVRCRETSPFTVTARCIADDRDHTAAAVDVTLSCSGACGDGVVDRDLGEECDVGAGAGGGCCTTDCRLAPDGASCSDGDTCDGDEVCHAGVCAPPTAAEALTCQSTHLVAGISNFDDDTLSLVDPATGTVSGTVAVGDGPWGVAVHPQGTEIWVTDRRADTVSVVDAATRTVVASVHVGRLPLGTAFSQDGARAYVASYDDDRVDVIDVATRTVVGHVPVGRGPAGLAFDASGRALYVANFAAASVSVIDAATERVVATVPVGRRPLELDVDSRRGRLYVTSYGTGRVAVIGTVSRTRLATLRVGRRPFGVAVDAPRGRVYVTNAASNTLSVIDAAAVRVVDTIAVDRGPLGVGVDPAGRVYVSSGELSTVAVIDPAGGTSTLAVGKLPVAFGPFIGRLANDCPAPAPMCDDGDPSTTDACVPPGRCVSTPEETLPAASALLAAIEAAVLAAPPSALGDAPAAAGLAASIAAARAELTPLGAQSGARPGRAAARLNRFLGRLARGLREETVDRDLGLRLLDLARAARSRLRGAG